MNTVAYEPYFPLYVALAALWIVLACLSFRAKRRARHDALWMSEPGCIGNAYELLRRIGTASSDRVQPSQWREEPVGGEGMGAALMSFLVVALVGVGMGTAGPARTAEQDPPRIVDARRGPVLCAAQCQEDVRAAEDPSANVNHTRADASRAGR